MACNLQLLMFCACTATLANALSVPQSSVPLPSRPLVSCHSTNYYYGAGTATRKITTSCNLRTQRQRRTYRKNIFALYLSDLDEMNADEGGIDQVELDEEDLDAFVEDLFAEVSDIAASPSFSGNETASLEIESPIAFSPLEDIVSSEQKDKDSPFFVQRQAAVGIGGNAGFVYDVNSLKRNLVQESVRRSKQELLALLGDGRQDEMISSSAAKDGKMNMVVVPQRWKRDRDDLIEERLSSLVQVRKKSYSSLFSF